MKMSLVKFSKEVQILRRDLFNLSLGAPLDNDEAMRIKENALNDLSESYVKNK